jgi:soluble lytic murein transglycosylase-like protein
MSVAGDGGHDLLGAGASLREAGRRVMRVFLAVLVLAFLAGCAVRREPVDRREVWRAIGEFSARYRLDPVFIYALVAAESGFDARARSGEARGLLQLKPAAWATVSGRPYEPTVWDWRANLEVGIDYLAWCRHTLHVRGKFSERLLLAAFHYGFDYVESRDFDERRIARPAHPIYRALWRGQLHPVPPPE